MSELVFNETRGSIWRGETEVARIMYGECRNKPEEAAADEIGRKMAAAEKMYETLRTIADFAVGNGDVCEIIAQRARAALRAAEGQ